MTTRHGKRRTRGSGTDTDESLVNRTRRLKKPVRGVPFSLRRGDLSALSGLSLGTGTLLVASLRDSMVASRVRSSCRQAAARSRWSTMRPKWMYARNRAEHVVMES
jgi:hypothetical protein